MGLQKLETLLTSYIDALRPIIYINHFDFQAVDKVIKNIAKEAQIFEYNHAYGAIDFENKTPQKELDLFAFLDLLRVEGYNRPTFFLLKDIYQELSDIKIITALRDIAEKTTETEGYYATIFIISSQLRIPTELEHLITVVDMPLPNKVEISHIIRQYAEDLDIEIPEKDVDVLALDLKGLSEFQLKQILNLAYQNGGTISAEDKHLILKEKEQVIKKAGMLEIINFKETIESIGGLEILKDWLNTKAQIFKRLDEAIKFGVDIPKGILIVGMPGCGKSLTSKVAANLFEVPLLRLDIGRLLGKYVGESENNLRKALQIAETISPCVLWIDEIEKAFVGVGSGGGSGEVTTRLFGNFLTWMQEKESTVFTIATANDISSLPPEFLRKGRFDEMFFVDLPNAEERDKIFKIHLKKRNKWHKEIDTIQLLKATEGFSGADIESVIKETIEDSFVKGETLLNTHKLLETVKATKSISVTLKEKIEKIRETLEKYDIKKASL